MYKVIVDFIDLQDNSYKYHTGDIFPRDDISVSDERLKELSTKANRRHIPLIKKVVEDVEIPKKKPVGRPRKNKNAE